MQWARHKILGRWPGRSIVDKLTFCVLGDEIRPAVVFVREGVLVLVWESDRDSTGGSASASLVKKANIGTYIRSERKGTTLIIHIHVDSLDLSSCFGFLEQIVPYESRFSLAAHREVDLDRVF
jgi:hypothetical protein